MSLHLQLKSSSAPDFVLLLIKSHAGDLDAILYFRIPDDGALVPDAGLGHLDRALFWSFFFGQAAYERREF